MAKSKKLIKLVKYYTKYKKLLVCTITLGAIYSGLSLLLPIIEGKILSNFNENLLSNIREVIILAVVLFAINLLGRGIIHLWSMSVIQLNNNVDFDLKTKMLDSILNLKIKNFDNTSTGVFVSRMNKDAFELSELFDTITDDATVVLTNAAFIIYALVVNMYLGLFLIITVLIIYILANIQLRIHRKNSEIYRRKDELVVGSFTDVVKGIKDVKNLGLEKSIVPKIDYEQNDAILANKKKIHSRRTWTIYRLVILDILNLLFVILSIYLISKQNLSIANFLIIYIYKNNVLNMTKSIINIREKLADGEVAATRVFELIDYEAFSKEEYGSVKLLDVKGNIEFKNVEFDYDEYNKLFTNLCFEIKENSMVAFVGKSGEGKSTILDLICKNYEPSRGKIYLDDTKISKLTKDSIKDTISVVTQEPYIFNMSFKENIRIANKDASDEEIIEVCKKTAIHNLIIKKKAGYDELVGENGITLSGGQKQRLAIARALIKKSKIILFDEATSSLDNHSQEEIKKLIKELAKDHTVVIVAHRLSTIVDADMIYVINKHKIEEKGTHFELMQNSEVYRSLYQNEYEEKQKKLTT